MTGKRRLARLVVEHVSETSFKQPPPPRPSEEPQQPTNIPRTLPHESFAEAVKQPSDVKNCLVGPPPLDPIQK